MDVRWLLSFIFQVQAFLMSAECNDIMQECNSTELGYIPMKVPRKSSWAPTTLDVYHFNGFDVHFSHLFIEVHLQINLTNEQTYQIYQGNNCSSMLEHYRDDQRLFGLLRYASIMRSKHLNPFGRSVLGVFTREPYTIRVRVWDVNYIRLGVFLGSIVLFLMSASLVRNALLYYAGGCAAGVVASLLIVAIIFYRFTPKRWTGLPILFGGWSLSFYIIYMVWKNFTLLLLQYQKFIAAYFATVTLISFAICYRYGPPTDVRSHNLAQWALQSIALAFIYFSCQIVEVAYSVMAVLLFWAAAKGWIVPVVMKFFAVMNTVRCFLFPKSRRLLTLEEYERQGEEETSKALDELRIYCSSPEVNAWKITSSLSDPKRFARFVDGSCGHVSEEESLLHELECSRMDEFSDDSGEDEVLAEQRTRGHASFRDVQHARLRSDPDLNLRRRFNKHRGRDAVEERGANDSDSDSDSDREYLKLRLEQEKSPMRRDCIRHPNFPSAKEPINNGPATMTSFDPTPGPSREPMITDDSESDSLLGN
uniref:Nuclear envelope integral membrane protein 1 n=1 Tax=Parascaris univalens TaxID=6257 RepID=A0A915B3C4_PARUN